MDYNYTQRTTMSRSTLPAFKIRMFVFKCVCFSQATGTASSTEQRETGVHIVVFRSVSWSAWTAPVSSVLDVHSFRYRSVYRADFFGVGESLTFSSRCCTTKQWSCTQALHTVTATARIYFATHYYSDKILISFYVLLHFWVKNENMRRTVILTKNILR